MRPRILIAATLVLVLAGCTTAPKVHAPVAPPARSEDTVLAEQLREYTGALQAIVQGNPAQQAELLADARAGYEQARQGPAVLRYALLLATPGHPAHDARAAQRLLQETRAHPELLSSVERALAVVATAQVQQELDLTAENARLVAEAQQERERQRNTPPTTAALAKRLQDEATENARLRKELDEARAKLDAIASIERNVPDRPPPKDARKP
jgi:hypothetical protein